MLIVLISSEWVVIFLKSRCELGITIVTVPVCKMGCFIIEGSTIARKDFRDEIR